MIEKAGVFKQAINGQARKVHLLLLPDFSMMAFASIIEPMRQANWISGKKLYDWVIVSRDGQSVPSSNGGRVEADTSIAAVQRPQNMVVCSGINANYFNDNVCFGWLRRWAREGCYIGAICTGAHILARAGLLNGYRCTIHWANLEGFMEEFPNLDVRAELFEIDRDRFTCAGGTSSLDMVLHDISHVFGNALAAAVSDQFMHERIRSGSDNQRLPLQTRLGINHPKLIRAIIEMEKHTEDPLSRDDIAGRVGLSRRQLERLFRRYLHTSPARHYLTLRLNRARTLLCQTSLPITEVAFACGFTSASHFSKCYRDVFHYTPRAERHNLTLGYNNVTE